MTRCPWGLIYERQIKYHDEEWGVSVRDDRKQFEYLMMEVMQSGLIWDTVLKKRGLKYIGSVTVYAHLQACGIINDHIKERHCYQRLIDQNDTEIIEA